MTVSAVGQFEIATAAGTLLMGASTVYGFTTVGGLDAVAVDTADIKLIGDGVYAAGDTKMARTVALDMKIVDRTALTASLGSVASNWQVGNTADGTLTYRWYGQSANRYVIGRARRCAWTAKHDQYGFGYVEVHVDFFCQDPRIFLSSDNSVVATF